MIDEREQHLRALLELRQQYTVNRRQADENLKSLDEDIRIAMIQYDIAKFEHDGWRMKMAEGLNTTIIKKKVIETLMGLDFGPEEIEWFMGEVTKETPYEYVDMRKVSMKEGQE